MKNFYKNLHALGYDYFTIPKLTYVEALYLMSGDEYQGEPVHKFKDDELRIKMLGKKALRRR